MVYWIKDAIDGKDSAHRYFIRFGKGIYNGRGLMSINLRKFIIKGSFENVPSILVWLSKNRKIKVNGKILSKEEIDNSISKIGLKILNKKKKEKLVEYIVEGECSNLDEINEKAYFFLIDVKNKDFEFKCKKNLPKPSTKETKLQADFFTLTLKDKILFEDFKKEFLFDIEINNSKKIEIEHDLIIDKIDISGLENLEKQGKFEELRNLAKREGKIIRKINIDGKEIVKEYKIKI
ncbi:MAG: hypothetical protein QXQ30_01900 [Candidatus Pacearchaeota archaeon]